MIAGARLAVFLHVVSGIVLVGAALFWVVMAAGVRRDAAAGEAGELLATTAAARWPPRRRGPALPLGAVSWVLLGAVLVTGLRLFAAGRSPLAAGAAPWNSGVMAVKLGLFALLVAGHAAAAVRPRVWILWTNGALALALVIASAFLRP